MSAELAIARDIGIATLALIVALWALRVALAAVERRRSKRPPPGDSEP
jgi:hypothetical protein